MLTCTVDNDEMEDNSHLSVDSHIPIKEDTGKKIKIPELKEKLKKRGQPLSGKKIHAGDGKKPAPNTKSDKSKNGGG